VGLEVAGLAAISAGGFVVTLWLGLILLGLSLWVVSWMVGPESE
jgi:hypothetical protein